MSSSTAVHETESPELRKGALGFWGVLAQSVGNIGPSGAPLVAIPAVAISAAGGTWASFLIATIGIILIALSIKAFAKDFSGTGSLYGYISRSLGPNAGVVGGWALVIAYIGIASACIPLFAYFVNILLEPVGISIPPLLLTVAFTVAVWFWAWKDIRLSAHTMLIIEIVSLTIGTVLAAVVLFKQGGNLDTAQFTLSNLTPSGIALGMVLAVTAFTGFESAASVGDETKNPLKTIPKAILISSVVSAVYFVVWSYALIAGFRDVGIPLAESAAPVTDLAKTFGVPALAYLLSAACTVGTFAVVLASINAGSRTLHLLAEHGVLHSSVSNIHKTNRTPDKAVTLATIAAFLPAIALVALNVPLLSIWAYIGTYCTFGFLVAYLLISVGAPVHLYRKGELKWHNVLVAVLAVGVVLIPFVGSVYPVPPAPFNYLFYIFIATLGLGVGAFLIQRVRDPHLHHRIKSHLDDKYDSFATERGVTATPATEA